jgi:hypothetical protein
MRKATRKGSPWEVEEEAVKGTTSSSGKYVVPAENEAL